MKGRGPAGRGVEEPAKSYLSLGSGALPFPASTGLALPWPAPHPLVGPRFRPREAIRDLAGDLNGAKGLTWTGWGPEGKGATKTFAA